MRTWPSQAYLNNKDKARPTALLIVANRSVRAAQGYVPKSPYVSKEMLRRWRLHGALRYCALRGFLDCVSAWARKARPPYRGDEALRVFALILTLITTITACSAKTTIAECKSMEFEPYVTADVAPTPLKTVQKNGIKDGMTLGQIVGQLGPGWISRFESIGIITWLFDDDSRLRVWPDRYIQGDTITFLGQAESATSGKMWWDRSRD